MKLSAQKRSQSHRKLRKQRQVVRRHLQFETLGARRLLAVDTLPAGGDQLVAIQLEAVHPLTGEAITEVPAGGSFVLRGTVDDLRIVSGGGVFAAYTNIQFPEELARVDGPITFDDDFRYVRLGDAAQPGAVTRVGAARGLPEAPGVEPQALFEIPMIAEDVGNLEILATPTNDSPFTDTLLYGIDQRIPAERVRYGMVSIDVFADGSAPRPTGISDGYAVDEDQTLTVSAAEGVLQNDRVDSNDLTLSSLVVSQPQHGTLTLETDGSFQYTPDANFSGVDSFQYRAFDGTRSSTATKVVIDVAPVDDAPLPVPDQYVIQPGGTLRVSSSRGVLSNDQEVDAQPLTARLVSGPATGTLEFAEDGSFEFVAPEEMTEATTFEYEASDGVFTTRTTVTLRPAASGEEEDWEMLGFVIAMRLQVTDADGNPISTVPAGGEFFVETWARDLRPQAAGVFSAYLDITYDSELATAEGTITYGDILKNGKSGDLQPGLVDELGAFSDSKVALDGNEYLVARVPFTADAAGTLVLTGDNADLVPGHESLLYGINVFIEPDKVRYGETSIEILAGVDAVDDQFSIDEDRSELPLAVLDNDRGGSGTTLQIVSVSPAASGAILSVSEDGKTVLYSGVEDYFGTDSFTYIVEDSDGRRGEASVSLNIENINDPPEVNDDQFALDTPANQGGGEGEQSNLVMLPVLQNDSAEPDIGESLTIVGVTDSQGQVTISPDGKSLQYDRSNAPQGTRTITYTVSDGNGATSTATVTLGEGEAPDSPWQNPVNPLDVNDDGFLTPIDVLYMINRINHGGGSELTEADLVTWEDQTLYLDTNGDRNITSIDVLLAINALNQRARGSGGAEGESGEGEVEAALSSDPAGNTSAALAVPLIGSDNAKSPIGPERTRPSEAIDSESEDSSTRVNTDDSARSRGNRTDYGVTRDNSSIFMADLERDEDGSGEDELVDLLAVDLARTVVAGR